MKTFNFRISENKILIIALFLAFLTASLLVFRPAQAQETERVKFSYTPNTAATSINVAGTFNEWNKDAAPMTETAGGVWEAELDIPAGSHHYKFVINGGVWVADPSNPETMDDGQGGKNSVIHAGRKIYERLGKIAPKDSAVETDGLMHKPTEVKFIDFTAQDRVRLVLRSFKNDLSAAYILKAKNKKARFELAGMKKFACDGIYDYYRTYIENCDSHAVYLFKADSGAKSVYFGFKGAFEPGRGESLASNAFGVPDYVFMSVNKAGWLPDAVFYQIFPDRFRDADASINQKFVQAWGSEPKFDNFTGGDLKGAAEKLDHLKELGANAIYLNPIFKSFSNHKYDTVDYFQIDPTLGGPGEFDTLVKKAHGGGMKIILDGVFNHTSTDFFAFADVREKGAKSEYADWYNFKSFPVDMRKPNYDCWWNIGSMPKLNIKNQKVYDYLLTVPAHWLKTSAVDGFRLDVPEQLPHSFWKDFRRTVKSVNKDACIIGEIWADGSKWLAGDQFDSVMNYKLRNDLIAFFVKKEISADQLDVKLAADKINLPDSAFFSMFNLLGSHDTPRILTVCGGDMAALKNMIMFIMTYPGAPCVYYGDEIGLDGGKDPDNRRCMIWDESKWNKSLLDFYKKAIAARNENIELRRGELFTYSADAKTGIYSFVRVYGNSSVLAAFNNSKKDGSIRADLKKISGYMDAESGAAERLKTAIVTDIISGASKKYDAAVTDGFGIGVAAGGFAVYKVSFVSVENK
ncbi:MAG: hypothetical protein A2008_02930 [Candidatus Wallbacteria bacterium GWC2_49_35]|uniref:Glycosyl hydrolase family 13 catalytic domain-containing protein n=1 Tax=Candidatus Wallbacteria bacterium GWC2_49_35 TaxID=1817813 RepID=A0A1F7WL54_9BACT|nr:MAG: hypothetical protein A2008_02930 [Candidatus Wallbacteria bacterium GWC2_49_35]HBC76380.1 alpha-glycosidase [Candidatus Wallbacteria bacterium]